MLSEPLTGALAALNTISAVNRLDPYSDLVNVGRADLQDTLDILINNFNTLVQVTAAGLATAGGEANTASSAGGISLVLPKSGVDLPFKGLTAGTGITITPSAVDLTISSTGEANTSSSAGGTHSLVLAKVGVDLPFKGLTAGGGITITPSATDLTISAAGSEPFTANGTVIHFNDGTTGQKEVLYDVVNSVLPLANADNVTLSISRTARQIRGGGTALPTTLVDTSQRFVTQRNLGDQVSGDGDMWLRAFGNTGALFSDPPFIFEHHGTSSTTWPYNSRSLEINQRGTATTTNVGKGDGGGISLGYDTGNGQGKWLIKAACNTTSVGSVSNLTDAALLIIGQGAGGAFIRSAYTAMHITGTGGVVDLFPNVNNFGTIRFPYHTSATGTSVDHSNLPANAGTINSGQLSFFVNNCTLFAKCAGTGSVVKIGPSPSLVAGQDAPVQTANDGGTVTQTGNQFTVNLPASGNAPVVVSTPFIPGSVQDIVIQNQTAIGTGNGLTQIDFGDNLGDPDRFGSKTTFTINHVTNRDNWTVTTEQFGTMYFTNTTAASTNMVLTPTGDWGGGTILITIYILKTTIWSY